MSVKIKLEDALGEAASFLDAIYLAAGGLMDRKDTNALQLVADAASAKLKLARDLLDDIREDAP